MHRVRICWYLLLTSYIDMCCACVLTQIDGQFGGVAFNVGATLVAVAYDDKDKPWEAISKDALATRASLARNLPTRESVFVVPKGKAEVASEDGKRRQAPAAYLRGCVFQYDKCFEMYWSYEPVGCPSGKEDSFAANYGKPPHADVLSSSDVVRCMPPMVVATIGDRNSSAPKEPRLGRLLAVAVGHVEASDGKIDSKRMCLVRFAGDTPDCFLALKSVARCKDPVEELLPEAVEWGSSIEQV